MTDGDGKLLMLEFQATGNTDACHRLFLMHRDSLWRFLLRLRGTEADADDFSQRTWLKVIEAAERKAYRPKASATFQTWLFTIARNMVIDDFRTLRAKAVHTGDEATTSLADDRARPVDTAVDDENAGNKLRAAMATVPLQQREVLALWAEGFGFDEIATMVGAPRNTVIGRKKYGMEKLRAALPRGFSKDRTSEAEQ